LAASQPLGAEFIAKGRIAPDGIPTIPVNEDPDPVNEVAAMVPVVETLVDPPIVPEVMADPLTLPAVAIGANFVSAIAAEAEMSASVIPEIVALSTSVFSLVGVTTSPETKVLPLVRVAIRGK